MNAYVQLAIILLVLIVKIGKVSITKMYFESLKLKSKLVQRRVCYRIYMSEKSCMSKYRRILLL